MNWTGSSCGRRGVVRLRWFQWWRVTGGSNAWGTDDESGGVGKGVFSEGLEAGVRRLKAKFLRPRSMLSMRAVSGMCWADWAAWRRVCWMVGLEPAWGRPVEEQRDWSWATVSLPGRGSLVVVMVGVL